MERKSLIQILNTYGLFILYICREAFTDGPLDKGGHELDLVELETSCPLQGGESGTVEECGIGAHPNCLCCPGK